MIHRFFYGILKNPDKISKAANNIINSDVELYISIVSFWEIAVKVKIGKLELPFTSFTEFYNFSVLKNKVNVLDLTK